MGEPRGCIGLQPVRALEGSVLHWFETKYPEFVQELKDINVQWGLPGRINYYCDKVPIIACDPQDSMIPHVDENGVIGLHETFMCYLWALSYGFLVVFDEDIHGPNLNESSGHGQPIGTYVPAAYDLLNYGARLLQKFSEWPPNLPDPEKSSAEDQYYVQRANGVYVAAADFILCHEVAHVACGHTEVLRKARLRGKTLPSHDVRQMEIEADAWALYRVMKGVTQTRTAMTVKMGAISGLGSLLFLSSRISSHDHPDTDDRLTAVLSAMSADATDNAWGVASAYLMAWNQAFKKQLEIPVEVGTYKELYESIRLALESLKSEEVASRFILD